MTKIGAICLVTIGAWIVIMLGVQFGRYKHTCSLGDGMPRLVLERGGTVSRKLWLTDRQGYPFSR
jgi:hypothetical protein